MFRRLFSFDLKHSLQMMAYNCSRGPVDILSLTVDAVGLWGSDNLNNNEDQLQSPQQKNVAKPQPQLQPQEKNVAMAQLQLQYQPQPQLQQQPQHQHQPKQQPQHQPQWSRTTLQGKNFSHHETQSFNFELSHCQVIYI